MLIFRHDLDVLLSIKQRKYNKIVAHRIPAWIIALLLGFFILNRMIFTIFNCLIGDISRI